jgi:hypothetical protein
VKIAVMIFVFVMLQIAVALALWAIAPARASPQSECSAWAARSMTIARAADPNLAKLNDQAIVQMQLVLWSSCLRSVGAEREGTAPAVAHPNAAVCRKRYVSYDEATGTVVRKGTTQRVPCPLTADGKLEATP